MEAKMRRLFCKSLYHGRAEPRLVPAYYLTALLHFIGLCETVLGETITLARVESRRAQACSGLLRLAQACSGLLSHSICCLLNTHVTPCVTRGQIRKEDCVRVDFTVLSTAISSKSRDQRDQEAQATACQI
jgi:hypothetical protein